MSFSVSDYAWPAFQSRKPFDHQRKTVRFLLANLRALCLNDMGCVDADTEFLSPTGWKRIADWSGEDVAQWNELSKQISFVKPVEYIKKPCDEFIVFPGLMTLSPEHRVVGRFKGQHDVRSALEVALGHQSELYRTFKAPERVGMPYTDEVLRVIVAYVADGSPKDGYMYVRLKLQDKIDRMRQLLVDAKIDFRERSYESDDRTNFIFVPPIMVQEYDAQFFDCTEHQLKIVCDEIWRWDGRKLDNRHKCWEFSTMRKVSADFVQYAFSAIGHLASITRSSKQYKYKAKAPRTREENEITTMYIVRATMYKGVTEFTAGSSLQKTGDGFKYCFTLPDTFWLMRRHDKIVVTGNTGKTLSALWASDILIEAKKIRRVLVISPLSTMKSVWYMEVMLNIPHRKVVIAHGSPVKRQAALKDPSANFVIVNHDGIKSCEEEIIRQQFDLIIIDELTAYKSHSSERTKCMQRIADRAKAVWGMTGDMTPNSPLEAFSQCKIVVPKNQFLPRYFGQFRDACMYRVNEMMWLPKPEAPHIVAMVAQPAIRFTREQCLDLPDTSYHTMEVELTPEQTKAYDLMKKQAALDIGSGAITAANAAVLLNKLCQISAGAVKNNEGTIVEIGCKPRMDRLFEIFEETPQKKLVVFATYRATIAMLEREMAKRGVRGAAIYGDVNQNLRAQHIEQFQNGNLQMLILQPQSAAHGITLTAASTMVWFSLVASNELHQQGNARIVRAGQTRKTQIIYFVSTKAERHLADILQRKGDLSKETLNIFEAADL